MEIKWHNRTEFPYCGWTAISISTKKYFVTFHLRGTPWRIKLWDKYCKLGRLGPITYGVEGWIPF